MKNAHRPRRLPIVLAAAAALLAGCAASPQQQDGVGKAVTTPLSDLNLVNAPIPEVLAAARRAPYAAPADRSCPSLAAQVRALDEVLGPDLDAPASESNPGLLERGGDLASGALQRGVEGLVPFRGWIRKLSGAERYSREVAAAITAGGVRRGYLRGLSQAAGCGR